MIVELLNKNKRVHAYMMRQRSVDWYKVREQRWTGSTIINLLKSPNAVIPSLSEWDNDWSRRGRILEDRGIEAYELQTYNTTEVVRRYGFITNILYPNAGYSPDGIDGNYLIEIKCFKLEKHNDVAKGNIPIEVIAQIQLGLLITDLRHAKLILYNPDAEKDLVIIDIKRDEQIIKHIKERLDGHDQSNKK